MSEQIPGIQRIEGSEVLDPRVYGRLADSVSRLAADGGTAAVHGRFMLATLFTAEEDLEESPDINGEIGDYTEFGNPEGEGWARFTWFDESAAPVLREYLGDEAENLRGQFEFAKDAPGASLHGLLRLYDFKSGAGHANAQLFAAGHMHDAVLGDPVLAQSFWSFARRYGLDSLWSSISTSPLPVSMQGHISPRMGWPIARALDDLSKLDH